MTARRGGFSVGPPLGRTALGTRYIKSHDNPLRAQNIPKPSFFEVLDDDDDTLDDGNALLQNFLGGGDSKKRTADGGLKTQRHEQPPDIPVPDTKRPIGAPCRLLDDEDPLELFLNLDDAASDDEEADPAATVSTAQTTPIKQESVPATATSSSNNNNYNYNTSQNPLIYESDDDSGSATGDIPPFAPTPQRQDSPILKSPHKTPKPAQKHPTPAPSSSLQAQINDALYTQRQQPPLPPPPPPIKTPQTKQPRLSKSKSPSSHIGQPQRPSQPVSVPQQKPQCFVISNQHTLANHGLTNPVPSPLPYRKKPTATPSVPSAASKSKTKPPPKPRPVSNTANGKMSTSSADFTAPVPQASSSGSRRPRRNVAKPVDYFAPPPGFPGYDDANGGEEDSIMEEPQPEVPVRQPRKQAQAPRPSLPPNKVAQRRTEYPIIYQTSTMHARREPLTCDTAVAFLNTARTYGLRKPYVDHSLRTRVGQMCASLDVSALKDGEGEVLHCDFSFDEIKGIYSIIAKKQELPSELEDPDTLRYQLARTVKRRHAADAEIDKLARWLTQLNSLRKAFAKAKTSLVQCRDKFMDTLLSPATRKVIIDSLAGLRVIASTADPNIGLQDLLAAADREVFEEVRLLYPMTRALKYRNKATLLKSFLLDVRNRTVSSSPSLTRALPNVHAGSGGGRRYHDDSIPSLLRTRELGYNLALGRRTAKFQPQLKPWKSWKGASNDITKCAWSPDGTRFIAGATSHCDALNMQYNRDKNLLLGDLCSGRLRELPDHRMPRPASNQQITTSDHIYMSLSQVLWRGDRVYTSSFDKTVKVWDAAEFDDTRCIRTLKHADRVEVLDVSTFGAIATANGSNEPCFSLWSEGSDETPLSLPLHKGHRDKESSSYPKLNMTASSVQWGNHSSSNYLVGGLSGNDCDNTFDPPKDGKLVMWQLRDDGAVLDFTKTMNVFDVKWHPELAVFAVGSGLNSSDNGVGRDTRSVIRLFEPETSGRAVMEYLCPALDINEVLFCPTDKHYIAASCTDGVTYVFDHRNPSAPLHTLVHGEPLSQWPYFDGATREQGDFGIGFAAWRETDELYTGCTDGVVKKWDILKAPEDVLTEDVLSLNVEISCGGFSPDYTHLLLGDTTGAIHVYSSAPVSDLDEGDNSNFIFEEAVSAKKQLQSEDSGVSIARESIASGELLYHHIIGVVQGPAYGHGPHTRNLFASWARAQNTSKDALMNAPLLPEIQARQLLCPDYSKLSPADTQAIDRNVRMGMFRNRDGTQKKRKMEEAGITPLGPSPSVSRSASVGDWSGLMSDIPHGLPVITISDSEDEDEDWEPMQASDMLALFTKQQVKVHHGDDPATGMNGEGASGLVEELEEDYWWPQLDARIDRDVNELSVGALITASKASVKLHKQLLDQDLYYNCYLAAMMASSQNTNRSRRPSGLNISRVASPALRGGNMTPSVGVSRAATPRLTKENNNDETPQIGAAAGQEDPDEELEDAPAPFPPPQTFDILPSLHDLLSRLITTAPSQPPTVNVGLPGADHLLSVTSNPAAAAAAAAAGPRSTVGSTTGGLNIDPKALQIESAAIKRRVQKAQAAVEALPDMHRSVEEQENEIVALEKRIAKLKGVLADFSSRSAAVLEEMAR
ncbi:hypothetical protein KEM56_002322 [Ascosphaera pollenicola]|nr:hypothetical protein KEM56_002322 [Ascosphaera pollenicola]